MLDSRFVEDHESLCPAAYAIGETKAGSGVLCRVSGRVVATGTDPSSLASYCWSPVAGACGAATDGSGAAGIGYQSCPVWRYRREYELKQKAEWAENTPQRAKEGFAECDMISPA